MLIEIYIIVNKQGISVPYSFNYCYCFNVATLSDASSIWCCH